MHVDGLRQIKQMKHQEHITQHRISEPAQTARTQLPGIEYAGTSQNEALELQKVSSGDSLRSDYPPGSLVRAMPRPAGNAPQT